MKFLIRWIYWAVKLRTIPPLGVGYVFRPNETDIVKARAIAKELGLI
jgi:hypothetical protein